jgi:hypothetical protein
MLSQRGFQLADLAVELGDDAYRGAGGGGERRGYRGGWGQLLRPQRGLDLTRPDIDIA